MKIDRKTLRRIIGEEKLNELEKLGLSLVSKTDIEAASSTFNQLSEEFTKLVSDNEQLAEQNATLKKANEKLVDDFTKLKAKAEAKAKTKAKAKPKAKAKTKK